MDNPTVGACSRPGDQPPPATYTHGHGEAVLRSHRWRTVDNSAAYVVPYLARGGRLLDVGCGPGTITADLARRTTPGRVTALEVSDAILDLARAEAASQQVDNIDFAVGDVARLDFPDATFDVVHAHQVLQHVGDPVGALREMRRVCRPDGVVAVRDSDYAAFVWFPALPLLDEWLRLYHRAARANGGEPDAGRRLLSWSQQAGFSEIESTSSTWCFSTPDDRSWWGGLWADRIVDSELAHQLVRSGMATTGRLREIADAWREWAESPDGWFSLLHGEIIARP